MKSGLLFQLMWCALLAQGNARYVGNISRVDIDPVPADEEAVPGSDTFSSALNLWAKKKPDCEKLKHPVDEDPRWDFETASLASCECWSAAALLRCKVVIPNDHIFDESYISKTPQDCGRSVYKAVSRIKSAKSQPRCDLDHDNVGRLNWKNGIGTSMKTIQKGFDAGTCGYFRDVQCRKTKGPR